MAAVVAIIVCSASTSMMMMMIISVLQGCKLLTKFTLLSCLR